MFARRDLKFPHKAVLTSSMLEEIYSYPRELSRLTLNEYGNGIICGLDYSIREGDLILSAGIFHLDNELYLSDNDINISNLVEENSLVADTEYFITLKKRSHAKEPCLTETNLELCFDRGKSPYTLGSFVFIGRNDFSLPTLTVNNDPFENIFQRAFLNLLEVPFADRDGSTFHPLLFRLVKEFLSGKKNKTLFDYALLVHLQSNATLSTATLAAYIAEAGKSCVLEDRRKFFRTFLDCLRESKFNVTIYSSAPRPSETPSRGIRTIGKLI